MPQPEMVKTEFHCHTWYSKDSLVRIQDLPPICAKKGLQKLVVTDHNTIVGALQAHELDPRSFVIGEEIMTSHGELLGIFVKEHIPAGLSGMETIEMLRSQGAFISVSHPFDAFREGHWELADLLRITPFIDAIEVF
jgi:predicted metal-dependent phosphoesterase TrpH